MEKRIEIDHSEGEGNEKVEFKGCVFIKRLNFTERNNLEEEATDIKFIGNIPSVRVSTTKLKELSLIKSITNSELTKTDYSNGGIPISSKYALDVSGIGKLPNEIGEQLFYEWGKINSVSEKKKEN